LESWRNVETIGALLADERSLITDGAYQLAINRLLTMVLS
jgi:hypothetical protein